MRSNEQGVGGREGEGRGGQGERTDMNQSCGERPHEKVIP